MMRQVYFQKHTVMGRLPILDRMYDRHFAALLGECTEVTFGSLPAETYQVDLPEGLVRYGCIETLFASFFGLRARAVEAAGYDAYVIGTSQDPGIELARALVDIPVVGYGHAAASFARTIADRFTFVGFIPELEEVIRRNMASYGFADHLTPFSYIVDGAEVVSSALQGEPDAFVDRYLAACREAIAAGAEAIIPGEGLPNEILWSQGITEVDGVPIVDADGAAVMLAEQQARMYEAGVLQASHTGYFRARPPEDMLAHIVQLFAPAAMDASKL